MTDECRKCLFRGEAAGGHCEAPPGPEPEGSVESAVSLTSTEPANACCSLRVPPENGGLTARDGQTWPSCQARAQYTLIHISRLGIFLLPLDPRSPTFHTTSCSWG